MKKYELTKNTKNWCGTILYQIKALKEFGNVSKGELGGFIEKEESLEHDGNAWVYGNARVFGDASVSGDARVFGDASVSGDARVSGNAWVYGNARVSGDARVFGDASVSGDAWVYGKIKLEFGWCFGRKRKDWDVTELENEEEILLIKDYQPATEEKEKEINKLLEHISLHTNCKVEYIVENYYEEYLDLIHISEHLNDENELLQSQLDIANKKLEKLDNEIKSVINIIKQQPSNDDEWILGRLNGFLSIIGSE